MSYHSWYRKYLHSPSAFCFLVARVLGINVSIRLHVHQSFVVQEIHETGVHRQSNELRNLNTQYKHMVLQSQQSRD